MAMMPAVPSGALASLLFRSEEAQFPHDVICQAQMQLAQIVRNLRRPSLWAGGFSRQARVLSALLFQDVGLKFRLSEPRNAFTLTNTLLTRSGNCLGLTSVYLAIADQIGMKVQPLLYDRHIAVGCRLPEGIQTIEMSCRGAVISQERAAYMYTDSALARLLSGEQFLAVHGSNRAVFVLAADGKYIEAVAMLQHVADIFPNYVPASINRAAVLWAMDRRPPAIEILEHVLTLSLSSNQRRHAVRMLDAVSEGRYSEYSSPVRLLYSATDQPADEVSR